MTHVSVTLGLRAHKQPKLIYPGVRCNAQTWRYGDKETPVPLANMLYSIGCDLAQFYAESGAATEPECVEQLRKGLEMLTKATDEYEQALIEGGIIEATQP